MPTHRRRTSRIPARILGGLALGLGLAAALVSAQGVGPRYPRSEVGRFEVEGLDFRPDGAWRRSTDAIRRGRLRSLRSGGLARLNGAGVNLRVAGQYRVPVVPIAFSNVSPPFPAAQYQNVLFAAAPAGIPYSVRTYYSEVSRGQVSIDGSILNWVAADTTDIYYEDGCNGVGVLGSCAHGGARFGELLLGALAVADDGSVDWGTFDGDGPDGVPNSGDDDGAVDFVLFLQPEVDGACGNSNLWSHRWDVRGWNGGSGFVTSSPVRDAVGQPVAGRFIQIRDYTLQSAVGGPAACDGTQIMPIGTVAHETGHAFGLPDLYDTNLRNSLVTQGIGEWGLMGSGNYSMPYSPAAFDAWSLAEMGWVTVDTVSSGGTVTLSPVATSDTVRYRQIPGTDEYFLFENRQAIGSDSAQMNPACTFRTRNCAKSPGLLLWHIDAGQVLGHGFRQDNRVNSGLVHGVALVQADGQDDLGAPGGKNRGDPGDAWPGLTGASVFSPHTVPAAFDNQGVTTGFELDSIRQVAPGGAVAFRLRLTPPGQVVMTLGQARDAILGTMPLGAPQARWMDSTGNANGRYDVGDLLLYYRSLPAGLRLPARGEP